MRILLVPVLYFATMALSLAGIFWPSSDRAPSKPFVIPNPVFVITDGNGSDIIVTCAGYDPATHKVSSCALSPGKTWDDAMSAWSSSYHKTLDNDNAKIQALQQTIELLQQLNQMPMAPHGNLGRTL